MSKQFNQRMIGVLVAIALVVILFPLLLTQREKAKMTVAEENAPAAPVQLAMNNADGGPVADATQPSADDNGTAVQQPTTGTAAPTAPNAADGPPAAAPSTVPTEASQPPAAVPPNAPAMVQTPTADQHPEEGMAYRETPPPAAPATAVPQQTMQQQPAVSAPAVPNAADSATEPAPQPSVDVVPVSEKPKDSTGALNKKIKPQRTVLGFVTEDPPDLKPFVEAAGMTADDFSDETPVVKKPARSKSLAKSAGKGWVVQLASFNNAANAKQLVDRLVKSGYHAFVSPAQEGPRNRVYVGPKASQAQAQMLVATLNKRFNLHGVVRTYQS